MCLSSSGSKASLQGLAHFGNEVTIHEHGLDCMYCKQPALFKVFIPCHVNTHMIIVDLTTWQARKEEQSAYRFAASTPTFLDKAS